MNDTGQDIGQRSLRAQRRALRAGKLPALNIAVLDSIDPLWHEHEYDRRWRAQHRDYAAFIATHSRVPAQTSHEPSEKKLGQWRAAQRSARQKNQLAPFRLDILNGTEGHKWDVFEEEWDSRVLVLGDFIAVNARLPGRTGDVKGEKQVARWFYQQRQRERSGQLTPSRSARLGALLGPNWELHADPWSAAYSEYRQFITERSRPPQKSSTDPDERRVGDWMHNQRTRYKANDLSAERIALLESIVGHAWQKRPGRRT